MLAIFDNDGTICDTQEVEGRCLALAIERVSGRSLASVDWTTYVEPTSTAIIRDLLAGDPAAEEMEGRITAEFCRLLEEERPRCPGDFLPIPGAVEFLRRIEREGVCALAIASGCFEASARFKLECCGIFLDHYPYATSTDTPSRREIISLAASRAGFALSSVVYFADGPWDVRASAALGIPMIGIGRRCEQLRSLGIGHVFRDYADSDRIIQAMLTVKNKMLNSTSTVWRTTARDVRRWREA